MGVWLKCADINAGSEVEIEGLWMGEEVNKTYNIQPQLNNIDSNDFLQLPEYADELALSGVMHTLVGSLTIDEDIPAGKMTLSLLRQFVTTTAAVYLKVTVGKSDQVVEGFNGEEWRRVVIVNYKLTPRDSVRQNLLDYTLKLVEIKEV